MKVGQTAIYKTTDVREYLVVIVAFGATVGAKKIPAAHVQIVGYTRRCEDHIRAHYRQKADLPRVRLRRVALKNLRDYNEEP